LEGEIYKKDTVPYPLKEVRSNSFLVPFGLSLSLFPSLQIKKARSENVFIL